MYNLTEEQLEKIKNIIYTGRGVRELYKIFDKTNKIDIVPFNKMLRSSSLNDRKVLIDLIDNPNILFFHPCNEKIYVPVLALNFFAIAFDYMTSIGKTQVKFMPLTEIFINYDRINDCCPSFIEFLATKVPLEDLMDEHYKDTFDSFSIDVKAIILRTQYKNFHERKYNQGDIILWDGQ